MSSVDSEIKEGGHYWLPIASEAALAATASRGTTCLGEIESGLGIKLPEGFRELVAVVQGHRPVRSMFVVWDPSTDAGGTAETGDLGEGQIREIEMFALSNMMEESPEFVNTIGCQFEIVKDAVSGLVPFAFDLRGNLICLDYGETWEDASPSVAYYDRGRNIGDDVFPVSASFSGFLDDLMSRPESEDA